MKLLLFTIAILGLSCTQNTAEAQNKLSPDAFETLLKNDTTAQLVDVRTPSEFQSGHIAGAVNWNIYDADFAQKINTLDKNRPVMVYCKAGGAEWKRGSATFQIGFSQSLRPVGRDGCLEKLGQVSSEMSVGDV